VDRFHERTKPKGLVKNVVAQISYSEYEKLKRKAESEGFTITKILRALIINYINEDLNEFMQSNRNITR
jgi:hypothetical protein